jgi:hypothetical protein
VSTATCVGNKMPSSGSLLTKTMLSPTHIIVLFCFLFYYIFVFYVLCCSIFCLVLFFALVYVFVLFYFLVFYVLCCSMFFVLFCFLCSIFYVVLCFCVVLCLLRCSMFLCCSIFGVLCFVFFYFLYCSMLFVFFYFCVVLCIVCFVSFCVLFLCKCVPYYCHRMATQLQLTDILYHIISYWMCKTFVHSKIISTNKMDSDATGSGNSDMIRIRQD